MFVQVAKARGNIMRGGEEWQRPRGSLPERGFDERCEFFGAANFALLPGRFQPAGVRESAAGKGGVRELPEKPGIVVRAMLQSKPGGHWPSRFFLLTGPQICSGPVPEADKGETAASLPRPFFDTSGSP